MAFLTLSCTPTWVPAETSALNGPVETNVCVHLPEEQLESARQAVEQWDIALRQWRRMRFVAFGSTNCYLTVTEVAYSMAPKASNGAVALAWVPYVGASSIFMVRGLYERDTTGILMHEIGHAMGASHLPGTLMHWQHRKMTYACPDAATVAQVAAWHRVDLRLLAWCS